MLAEHAALQAMQLKQDMSGLDHPHIKPFNSREEWMGLQIVAGSKYLLSAQLLYELHLKV